MARRFRFPLKKSPKSDPQQRLVYRMENEAIGARSYMSLTQREAQRFARAVCREYRLPRVEIRFKDLGKWAAEWAPPNIITLGKKKCSRDLLTIAHELAHHLHEIIYPNTPQEAHGPEFMACYMHILDTARMIPVAGMRAICEAYKIRFIEPGKSLTSLRRAVRGSSSSRLVQTLCLIES